MKVIYFMIWHESITDEQYATVDAASEVAGRLA